MSDFRAIGGVSATLQTLLVDRMELPDGMSSVPVTIGPPPFSSKDADPQREKPRLNLFLYRVTENGYLQNQEIPGRATASGYGHPPLSLNLHYLLTAYGNQEIQVNGSSLFDDTDAHFILGSAMRVLHDVPIVTDGATTVRAPSGTTILHESLRDEYERVRLSLEPLTLEDVTKVWTALALRFRLSAAYLVNVVQIESRRRRSFPRPVGQPASATVPPLPTDPPSPGPWIHALTIQTPTITDLKVRPAGAIEERPFPYAAINDTVVLRGTSLAGVVTRVAFGELEVPATFVSPTRVEAAIPDSSIAGSGAIPDERQLQPGIRTVKVIARNPQVPQSAFSSNDAAFMLVPTVDPTQLTYSAGPPGRALEIKGVRLAGASQGGETMIGRSSVPRSAYLSEAPDRLVVPIPPTLPTRGVSLIVGGVLNVDPVSTGAGPRTLRIDIDGTIATRTRTLPASLPRSQIAGIVESMIHDAAPAGDTRFTDARVVLWRNQLLVLAGDLTSAIGISSPAPSTFATALKLDVGQAPAASAAAVSGVLGSPPPLSSPSPKFRLKIGPAAAVTVDVPTAATSLDALAVDLQAAINAFAPAAYAGANVAVTSGQLLLIPGTGGLVTFGPVPGVDERTVVELQLHAEFAVRVRVNGAESLDSAVLELPQ